MSMFNVGSEQMEASLLGQDKIDLGQYWRTIRNYQWRIVALAMLITGLVAIWVMSITPRYVATASLLIEAEQTKIVSIEEVYGLDSSRKEYFQTQYEILRSRQIADKVVDKLDLVAHPVFDPANKKPALFSLANLKGLLKEKLPWLTKKSSDSRTPEQVAAAKRAAIVHALSRGLTISPIKQTQVVNISFESASPAVSAMVANAVAEVYIESYLQAKFEMTSKATSWLNDSLQGLKQKLDDAESRLAEFYEKEKLVNIDGVVGLAADELQALSEQLLAAQNKLKQSALIFEQLNAQAGDAETLSRLPVVQNHPSIQSINKAEINAQTKLSELSRVYGPKHPKMIAAKAELESIQQNLNEQLATLVSGLRGDYETTYRNAKTKVLDLRTEVAAAKSQYRRLTTLESKHKALQREVDINQQLYGSFFTRLKETTEIGGFESANARLLDPAVPPTRAAKPKKKMIVAAAFVVSLGVGVVLALLLDALNSGIRSVDEVERKLGQRMLGIVPAQRVKRGQGLPLRHYFDTNFHVFSEALRTIRTNLLLSNVDQQCRVILIASSVPKEGKSTVAVNLTFALGQLGKTLVIDADLRRASLAGQFGLPAFHPGLANLIAGTHSADECIVTDEHSAVDLMPAGSLPSNPQELLASERFKRLIKALRQRYSHIVIDTAPVRAVSDAMVVSKVCDALLYVVKADSTRAAIANEGLSRFLQAGHRVDGVVLNHVNMRKAAKTGNFAGFYDSYGYHGAPVDAKAS